MLELKIQCDCGQKYKFDVEPVNDRMPFTVKCPVCGADGTAKADLAIQAQTPIPVALAAPVTPVATLVPPVPATEQPRLRINLTAAHAEPSADAPAAPTTAPQRFSPGVATVTAGKSSRGSGETNWPLIIAGGVVGGGIGIAGWYFLNQYVYHETSYMAVVIGALAGFGVQKANDSGGVKLGAVAGVCALAAMLAGQFILAHQVVGTRLGALGSIVYEAKVEQVQLQPKLTGMSPEERVKAMQEQQKKFLEKAAQRGVAFSEAMAAGKNNDPKVIAQVKLAADMPTARWEAFQKTFTPLMFLFLALGAAGAYKIGAG